MLVEEVEMQMKFIYQYLQKFVVNFLIFSHEEIHRLIYTFQIEILYQQKYVKTDEKP